MTLQRDRKKLVSVGVYRFTGKTLGKGNFARVEEAVHNILNVKVAIKIMDVNQIKEDYVIRNLYREAKIMSKLSHPCIAALFQTMQKSDNVYYLVNELVPGGDLCTFVKGQPTGKLSESQTRVYARQFGSALAHMHSIGVVHRDLKMENVMLNSSKTQIKIVDFGLSNVWNSENPLRTHCGSPEYAAPELFVTGKQYGAEVDLWSFGIILYGMVLGQLPFVTCRSDYVSSQERRKRLVAQINKGLATAHRRSLGTFTSEFRDLMNRLLVAESCKRIAAKQLIVHPWITDRGKKLIRVNPLRELDSQWRAKIIYEIGCLLQVEAKLVTTSVTEDPLGKIAGMYNMLVHRHRLDKLSGDGVTKSLASIGPLELAALVKTQEMRENAMIRMAHAKRGLPKKPQTAAGIRRTDYCTPRVGRSSKPEAISMSKLGMPAKAKKASSCTKPRPNTVQCTIRNQANPRAIDYRLIKSPTLRRKVYSASITPTISAPSPRPRHSKEVRREETVRPHRKKGVGDVSIKEKNIEDFNGICKPCQLKPAVGARVRDSLTYSVQTLSEKIRCKSEHAAGRDEPGASARNRRPQTEQSGAARIAVTKSDSKATDKSSTAAGCHNRVRLIEEPRDVSGRKASWEQFVLGYGDSMARSSTTSAKQSRKPPIYDPIAKCIADYVVNNVPDKLHNFRWDEK